MSYTPEDQKMSAALGSILEGIGEVRRAIEKRIDAHEEWADGHLKYLVKLDQQLSELYLELTELRDSTN